MHSFLILSVPSNQSGVLTSEIWSAYPDAEVEVIEFFSVEDELHLKPSTLIFLWDDEHTVSVISQLRRQHVSCQIVVVSEKLDGSRADRIFNSGALDYRQLPLPATVFAIYLSSSEHRQAINEIASSNQREVDGFVSSSAVMDDIRKMASLVAESDASVFVNGKSGTGKEKISRFIHDCSPRHAGPFMAVNCAAIPEAIFESELFGHEKGAFTGADAAKPGKFELASGGTILLDEITEMPIDLQPKLLRVLQEQQVDRVGGKFPIPIDVRVIATSNRDMKQAIVEGLFREDLYYRLNVVDINLPALVERPEDIVSLVPYFLDLYCQKYRRAPLTVTQDYLDKILTSTWPGNIRQLENHIHKALVLTPKGATTLMEIPVPDVSDSISAPEGPLSPTLTIKDLESALVDQTLQHVQGDRRQARLLLNTSIQSLQEYLNRLDF